MSSRVVHFEIPSDDPQRSADFYSKAFGWTISKWDGPQEYWMVETGEDEPGINGGIMRRGGPFDRIINTVNVEDVDGAIRRVQELGATLVGEKLTIPSVGFLQYAQDPDGNVFGMLQPVSEAATV